VYDILINKLANSVGPFTPPLAKMHANKWTQLPKDRSRISGLSTKVSTLSWFHGRLSRMLHKLSQFLSRSSQYYVVCFWTESILWTIDSNVTQIKSILLL